MVERGSESRPNKDGNDRDRDSSRNMQRDEGLGRKPRVEEPAGYESRVTGGMRAFDRQYKRQVDELDYIVPRSGYFFEHDDRDVWTGPKPHHRRSTGFKPYARPSGKDLDFPGRKPQSRDRGPHRELGRDRERGDLKQHPPPPGLQVGTGEDNQEGALMHSQIPRRKSEPHTEPTSKAREPQTGAFPDEQQGSSVRRPAVRSVVVASQVSQVKHAMGEYRTGRDGKCTWICSIRGQGCRSPDATATERL
eukprot:jgi/Botrbrau1/563/Bobra.0010s0031.1